MAGDVPSLRALFRPLLVVTVALFVAGLPFLFFGERLESQMRGWFSDEASWSVIAWATFTVLSTDAFLPVPSSFVSTFAGMQLGIPLATLSSWAGMTLGASIGFAAARVFGRPIILRSSNADEVARIDKLASRYGAWLLVLTRAIPLLAETTVFLLGAAGLQWRRFLVSVVLSNLGISLAYSTLGHYGRTYGAEYYALAASIALPLLTATIVRFVLRQHVSIGPSETPNSSA